MYIFFALLSYCEPIYCDFSKIIWIWIWNQDREFIEINLCLKAVEKWAWALFPHIGPDYISLTGFYENYGVFLPVFFLHCNSQSYEVHEEITRLLSAITPITHSIIANPSQQDMRHNLLLHGIDTSPCLSLYNHKVHSIQSQSRAGCICAPANPNHLYIDRGSTVCVKIFLFSTSLCRPPTACAPQYSNSKLYCM